MCPGFGRRLNSWRVKVRHSAPQGTCSFSNPFTTVPVPLPFLPLPFPFFCHSKPPFQHTKQGRLVMTASSPLPFFASTPARLLSYPSRRPTHLLHQNKMSFFLFLFSISTGQRRVPHMHTGHSAAPVPHPSCHADCSPVLAT